MKTDRRGHMVPGDAIAAGEELGRACIVYPAGDVLTRLLDARPDLLLQAGNRAVGMSDIREEDEGKG